MTLAEVGRAEPALQAAAAISDPEKQAEALSRVAEVLARAGQPGQAADAARQALEAAADISDPEQQASVLSRYRGSASRDRAAGTGRRCGPASATGRSRRR